MIIYKTTNLLNGKIYIGQTRKSTPNYYGSGTAIKHAINKYGKENFEREILEDCSTEEELNKKERYWIAQYDACNPDIGYNLLSGGNNYSLTDNPNGEIIREKIKKNHAHHWKDISFSKEHRDNISKALKGKLSNKKGIPISEHTKELISKNNAKYWQGKHISEETKEKIRNTKKINKQDMTHLYAKHTLVKNGSIYKVNGVTKFIKEHSLSKTQFYRLIRGERKEYKGFSLQN